MAGLFADFVVFRISASVFRESADFFVFDGGGGFRLFVFAARAVFARSAKQKLLSVFALLFDFADKSDLFDVFLVGNGSRFVQFSGFVVDIHRRRQRQTPRQTIRYRRFTGNDTVGRRCFSSVHADFKHSDVQTCQTEVRCGGGVFVPVLFLFRLDKANLRFGHFDKLCRFAKRQLAVRI